MTGNTLHVERAKRRLSQREAADLVGLPFWRYYHIERGWKVPTPEEVARLAQCFDASPTDLFPPADPPAASFDGSVNVRSSANNPAA